MGAPHFGGQLEYCGRAVVAELGLGRAVVGVSKSVRRGATGEILMAVNVVPKDAIVKFTQLHHFVGSDVYVILPVIACGEYQPRPLRKHN